MTAFYPGQRVVCVKGIQLQQPGDEALPTKGTVYTIREAGPFNALIGSTNVTTMAVRLVEIVNRPKEYEGGFYEACFAAVCFRPIDESRIDIFRQMLAPVPVKEVA